MGCPLLMANQDVLYRILLEQIIIDMKNGTTRITEYILNSLIFQAADKDLRPA
jgi:hypothetical protein